MYTSLHGSVHIILTSGQTWPWAIAHRKKKFLQHTCYNLLYASVHQPRLHCMANLPSILETSKDQVALSTFWLALLVLQWVLCTVMKILSNISATQACPTCTLTFTSAVHLESVRTICSDASVSTDCTDCLTLSSFTFLPHPPPEEERPVRTFQLHSVVFSFLSSLQQFLHGRSKQHNTCLHVWRHVTQAAQLHRNRGDSFQRSWGGTWHLFCMLPSTAVQNLFCTNKLPVQRNSIKLPKISQWDVHPMPGFLSAGSTECQCHLQWGLCRLWHKCNSKEHIFLVMKR